MIYSIFGNTLLIEKDFNFNLLYEKNSSTATNISITIIFDNNN